MQYPYDAAVIGRTVADATLRSWADGYDPTDENFRVEVEFT
jgi:hypothetical protein